jgi:phage tail tape-measure protein
LTRRLKEAESRAEALAESVGELREALERQRQAADLREEMLRQVRRKSRY